MSAGRSRLHRRNPQFGLSDRRREKAQPTRNTNHRRLRCQAGHHLPGVGLTRRNHHSHRAQRARLPARDRPVEIIARNQSLSVKPSHRCRAGRSCRPPALVYRKSIPSHQGCHAGRRRLTDPNQPRHLRQIKKLRVQYPALQSAKIHPTGPICRSTRRLRRTRRPTLQLIELNSPATDPHRRAAGNYLSDADTLTCGKTVGRLYTRSDGKQYHIGVFNALNLKTNLA